MGRLRCPECVLSPIVSGDAPIDRTAPYMHDGSLPSLEEVIEFYDGGGRDKPHLDRLIRPLELNAEERLALKSFVQSLTGAVSEGVLVERSGQNED